VLDVDRLADAMDLERVQVYYALTKLTTDRLVSREPGRGYVVNAVDVEASDDAFDARRAIELAAAEIAVGRASAAELDQLRRRADDVAHSVSDANEDFDRWVKANADFHEYQVSLAHNASLLDFYRRLGIQAIYLNTLRGTTGWKPRVTSQLADHAALTAAIVAGDLDAAKAVIRDHSEYAKRLARDVITAAGGNL
jgi:DNA-binding GntR family transcriptional regulator